MFTDRSKGTSLPHDVLRGMNKCINDRYGKYPFRQTGLKPNLLKNISRLNNKNQKERDSTVLGPKQKQTPMTPVATYENVFLLEDSENSHNDK